MSKTVLKARTVSRVKVKGWINMDGLGGAAARPQEAQISRGWTLRASTSNCMKASDAACRERPIGDGGDGGDGDETSGLVTSRYVAYA